MLTGLFFTLILHSYVCISLFILKKINNYEHSTISRDFMLY